MTFPAYQFYTAARSCPACRNKLVTTEPFASQFMGGTLYRIGLACYCVHCNNRYRATSFIRFSWIAWAGPVGQWIWWQTARLEPTTPAADAP